MPLEGVRQRDTCSLDEVHLRLGGLVRRPTGDREATPVRRAEPCLRRASRAAIEAPDSAAVCEDAPQGQKIGALALRADGRQRLALDWDGVERSGRTAHASPYDSTPAPHEMDLGLLAFWRQRIALRTKTNRVLHRSHRCSTRISPSEALTWPAGVIASLWQAGHRRSRVSGSAASEGGMGRHRNTAGGTAGLAEASEPEPARVIVTDLQGGARTLIEASFLD